MTETVIIRALSQAVPTLAADGWVGWGVCACVSVCVCVCRKGLRLFGWWNVAPGPCGGKAVPSSPPCLCGTSSLDPLHIVIRGWPLRASGRQTVGMEGSGARWGTRRTNSNSSTCPIVPVEWVGWIEGERMTASSPSPPSQTPFFPSPSYPPGVVPSSALLFALAGCYWEGPLRCCLCNLLGNFQGHTIPPLLFHWRFSHLLPKLILLGM